MRGTTIREGGRAGVQGAASVAAAAPQSAPVVGTTLDGVPVVKVDPGFLPDFAWVVGVGGDGSRRLIEGFMYMKPPHIFILRERLDDGTNRIACASLLPAGEEDCMPALRKLVDWLDHVRGVSGSGDGPQAMALEMASSAAAAYSQMIDMREDSRRQHERDRERIEALESRIAELTREAKAVAP